MSGFKGPGIIPGYGAPEFVAPAGSVYIRYDDSGQNIDRVYVSNGVYPALNIQQFNDGAEHIYVLNDTSGAVAVDSGISPANGAYVGSYTLNQPGLAAGIAAAAILGTGATYGSVVLPFDEATHGSNGEFSIDFMVSNISGNVGVQTSIIGNSNPATSNKGINFYSGSNALRTGFTMGTAGGYSTCDAQLISVPNQIDLATFGYDGTNMFFYLNGALVASVVANGAYIHGVNPMQIVDYPVIGSGTIMQCVAFYPTGTTQFQASRRYAAAMGAGAYWNDLQTIMALNQGALPIGPINAIEAGLGLSGTVLDGVLTLKSTGGGPLVIENHGTSIGTASTLNAGSNITAAVAGSVATFSGSSGGGGGGGGLFAGLIGTQPTVTSMGYSWVIQRSATFANCATGVLLQDLVDEGGQNYCVLTKAAPSGNFVATIGFIASEAKAGANQVIGFGFYDSAGKMQIIEIQPNSGGIWQIYVQEWSRYSAYAATSAYVNYSSYTYTPSYTPITFLQISVSGTTVTFGWSLDGVVFNTLFTTNTASGYLANYTTLMVGMLPSGVTGQSASIFMYAD